MAKLNPPEVDKSASSRVDKYGKSRLNKHIVCPRVKVYTSHIMFGKILAFYTKYFAVWVAVFGLLAYFVPAPFISLKRWMDWFFALTMFGIGAVLEADDFKSIVRQPVLVLIGCCAQFTIMPVGDFLAAKAFSLPPELAVGLILTGAAPVRCQVTL